MKTTEILRGIVGKELIGFRAPLCSINQSIIYMLNENGYKYDSSIHPTFIPQRYNMLKYPTGPFYLQNSLLEIPLSVTPYMRLPIGWWWLRNVGARYITTASKIILRKEGILVFYFHPWDVVTPVKVDGVPWHIYRNAGQNMLHLLHSVIQYFHRKKIQFCTLTEVYRGLT